MAAIRLILTFTQGLTVAALKTSILIYIMRSYFLEIYTELSDILFIWITLI